MFLYVCCRGAQNIHVVVQLNNCHCFHEFFQAGFRIELEWKHFRENFYVIFAKSKIFYLQNIYAKRKILKNFGANCCANLVPTPVLILSTLVHPLLPCSGGLAIRGKNVTFRPENWAELTTRGPVRIFYERRKHASIIQHVQKCRGTRDTIHEIFRVVSRFPCYISCYISENRFPLGECSIQYLLFYRIYIAYSIIEQKKPVLPKLHARK